MATGVQTFHAVLAVVAVLTLVVIAVLLGMARTDAKSGSGDLYFDVAMGVKPGMQALTISGRNPEVSASNNEDLWDGGGNYPAPLPHAQTVVVSSDNPDDDEGGDGALSVLLVGVDGDYRSVRETVAIQGLQPVETTTKFLAVNTMEVASSGAYGVNQGKLVAVGSEAKTQVAIISPTLARSFAARYTVPADQTVLINRLVANINQPGDDAVTTAMFILWVQNSEDGGNIKPKDLFGVQASGDGHMAREFSPPLRVPPRSEISMSVSVSTPNVDVSADIYAVTVKGAVTQ